MADVIELWTSDSAKRRSRRELVESVYEDRRRKRLAIPIAQNCIRRNKEIFDLRTQFAASYADIARAYGLRPGHVQDVCRMVARQRGFSPENL
jgi:hypothetical protein